MRPEHQQVSHVLRAGVLVSFILLTLGIAASLIDPPVALLEPESPATLLAAAVGGSSTALIHLGLLVLMLTPFARVLVLVMHFVRMREVPFALFTIGVLCLLIVAVVVGLL